MITSNIATAINAAHAGVEAAKKEGARYAIECGRLLHDAKGTVEHGAWDAWVRQHCRFSARTAQLYMRMFKRVEADPAKAQRVADLSLRALDRETRARPSRVLDREPIGDDEPATDSMRAAFLFAKCGGMQGVMRALETFDRGASCKDIARAVRKLVKEKQPEHLNAYEPIIRMLEGAKVAEVKAAFFEAFGRGADRQGEVDAA